MNNMNKSSFLTFVNENNFLIIVLFVIFLVFIHKVFDSYFENKLKTQSLVYENNLLKTRNETLNKKIKNDYELYNKQMELIHSIIERVNKNSPSKFINCDITIDNHKVVFNGSYVIGMDSDNIIVDNYYIIKKEDIDDDIIIFRDDNGEPVMMSIDDFYKSDENDVVKNNTSLEI